MNILDKIRQKVSEEAYKITSHANEEMSEDHLIAVDIENAILNGQIKKKFSRDPRGMRYEIVGKSLDGRNVGIVCRILPSGKLLIITVYAL